MAPRFLVPSLLWYGLDPAVAGPALLAGTTPLSQWGGQLNDEAAVRAVLLTVEPAILLLVLAGYEVRTVVAGIPAAVTTAPQGLSARRDSFQLDKVVFPP